MKAKTIDLKGIFLTPPNTLKERLILFVMLVVTFMIFFGPLRFSTMHPLEAIATAMVPALSVSWGWVVFLRFYFSRTHFIKK